VLKLDPALPVLLQFRNPRRTLAKTRSSSPTIPGLPMHGGGVRSGH
jgi:hypothetical protein